MFKELDNLIRELTNKRNEVDKDQFAEWLEHPITIAMFADLKKSYLLSMDEEGAKAERQLIIEIINTWGEVPDEI